MFFNLMFLKKRKFEILIKKQNLTENVQEDIKINEIILIIIIFYLFLIII